MNAKRKWEVGALAALLAVVAAGLIGWGQYQARLRALERGLAEAMNRNDGRTVRLMLRRGAPVRATDAYQRTPLVWAAVFGDGELLRETLRRGGDVNSRARGDMTALMWAAAGGHREVVDLLLRSGAQVNARDAKGRTPLSWAADNMRGPDAADRQAVLAAIRRAGGTR